MTQYDEFDFSGHQGAAVAEASNKGGDFQREVEFLTLKADPASIQQGKHMAILRMLTEHEKKAWMNEGGVTTKFNFAWITVPQHYAATKQRPPYAREGANWPDKWSAVCRVGPVFKAKYGSCYLCEQGNKPSERSWAMAIEREQVIENGQVLGYRDKTREVFVMDDDGNPVVLSTEPDGKGGEKKNYAKKIVPAVVVLNFGWKNFFNALDGQAKWHQTILDRDYVVTRSGMGGSDTNYTFVALDPIILPEGNELGLPAGSKYDLGMIVGNAPDGRPIPLMEALYPEIPDLRKVIAERTNDDYFGRWFVPGWLPKDFDPTKVANQPAAATGYTPIVMGGAQQGYVPQGGQQQAAQPQQPTQAPAAPQPPAEEAPPANVLDGLKNRVLGGQPAQQG